MKKRRVVELCIVVLALTILGYASIWFVRQLAIETVRLTSGRQASFAGDPNQLIFEYIKTGNDPNQVHTKVGVPHPGGTSW